MSSFRPICQLCKRPFNPLSPGATSDFGPTCAKKALTQNELMSAQMGFGLAASPRQEKALPLRTKVTPVVLGKDAQVLYHDAKTAFDEIYRRFLSKDHVLYGAEAKDKYQELLTRRGIEVHSLDDSVLSWLEPEYRISLLVHAESDELYYWREFNGSFTLLSLDAADAPAIKELTSQIVHYTYTQKMQRKEQQETQLSLFGEA